MPAFNAPTPNDTGVADFTGRSQGTGPNRTFETLFKGIGNTVQDYAKVQDAVTQSTIEDQARAGFDQVNNEFGLNPPAGMSDGLDQMARLQNAVSQGKISEVNYYGRLATLSKQLRSKYPGYESIVDQKIQSVTGTRPANAYRDAIFQEINKAASEASSATNRRASFDNQHNDALFSIYGNDYFTNPDRYDFGKVQADVARFEANRSNITAQKNQLDLDAAQGQANDKQAAKVIASDFSFITQTAMNHATGVNLPSAIDSINSFVAKGGGSPEETKAFIDNISNVETNLRATLFQRGQEYVQKYGMSQDQVNKAIDAAMYPITQAKEAVLGGDFKLAGQFAVLSKISEDQQYNEMLKDPMFKAGSGLSKINQSLGDNYFQSAATQEGAFNKANTIGLELAGRAMAGDPKAIKKAIESGDDKLGSETLKQSFNIMTDPKISSEDFHNVFTNYFSGKAGLDFMDPNTVAEKDLDKIYFRFTSPDMTNAVFSKGTKEDQQNYINWALTKATAIPAFRNAAGDVNSLIPNGANLIWDDKNHRLGIHLPDNNPADSLNPIRAFEPPFMRNGATSNMARAVVSNFNQVLQRLDPILKHTGSDPDATAKALVRSLSISIDGQNPETSPSAKSSFWGSVFDAISNANDRANDLSKNDYFGETLPEAGGNSLFDFAAKAAHGVTDMIRGDIQKSADKYIGKIETSTKRGYSPDIKDVRPEVLSGFEDLQSAWGSKIPVVSGYRDPERNARSGGAKHSQHMHGNALDLDVSSLSKSQRVELIKMARAHGFTGIGVYPNSLHIDMGRKRHWGPSYHAASTPQWALAALQ